MRRAEAWHGVLAALVAGSFGLGAASAQDLPRGPVLGAASNFSQGSQENILQMALGFPILNYRDSIQWALAETVAGTTVFDGPRTVWPDRIGAEATASVTLNWGNPLWEDGATPVTPEGIAAFGAFAGTVVARFPNVDAIEVGNEFNGTNFVRGPMEQMSALERARAYVPLLVASAEAARAVRPEVRILGGATHSIPAGYLWEVLDAGGAGVMDALAIHPYTTPAEQFVRQIAVLRQHPAADLPIEITEFGSEVSGQSAGHLLRNYCQFALAGVTRAVWYPLNPRGDGLIPLFSETGRITPAGRAYRLAEAQFVGRTVEAVQPDPFTYGCRFGGDTVILWGAARSVTLGPGVTATDAEGRALRAPLPPLSPTAPIILKGAQGLAIGQGITLGPQRVIADSFDQYAYPAGEELLAEGDAFERFARRADREIPLTTLPGQEAPGTPWFPYRGAVNQKPVRLTADSLVVGGTAAEPVDVVHRYRAPQAMRVDLAARITVGRRSTDGMSLTVTLDGRVLHQSSGKTAQAANLRALDLPAGSVLEITVGPNGSAEGDVADYRITLSRP